jgi:tetratricopeptide (TPR) repeat protein
MKSVILLAVFLLASLCAIAQPRRTAPAEGNSTTTAPVAAASNSRHMQVYTQALKYLDYTTALNALHYELSENPTRTDLRDSLASLYFSMNAFPQSILAAKDVLAADANNQKMLELTAISYQSLGALKDAVENYEKLYRLSNEPFHLYQMSVLQYQLQRIGECQASLQRLVQDAAAAQQKVTISVSQQSAQQVPLHAAAYNVLGIIATEQNNKELAKQHFTKALELFPEFVLAKGNLETLNNPNRGQPSGATPSGTGTAPAANQNR